MYIWEHIWELKREGVPYEVFWKILAQTRVFNSVSKIFQLCLTEKYLIMFSPEGATLNKRTELYNSCRQFLSELLKKVK